MDRIIPWPELAAAVQTAYPKVSEHGGRPPIPPEPMLRICFLQLWFNLSDPAVEEALYDSVAMRGFVGIDLGVEGAPDETTVCKFRHLLERNFRAHILTTTRRIEATGLGAKTSIEWAETVQPRVAPASRLRSPP